MEQLRQIGEVLGSIKTIMAFQEDTTVNRRQCSLLADALDLAFGVVSEEIRENLHFSERTTKWGALENPLRELHRIFLEAELFVRRCTEGRDWRAMAVLSLGRAGDCVELHLHDLLFCLPAVIEAVEAAGEIAGSDPEDTRRGRLIFTRRYDKDWLNPALFRRQLWQRRLLYPSLCARFAGARRDDQRAYLDRAAGTGEGDRLGELVKGSTAKLFPSSILVAGKDYQVRRRLGSGSQYKEIHWIGENFAVRHFFGDITPLAPEILRLCSLVHPNVLPVLCAFSDKDRNECFILMELMHRSLCNHIKKLTGRRRRNPFTLPDAVDIMLQISEGMEYLHCRQIPHGNLSSSSVLVKESTGHLRVKVAGIGLSTVKNPGGGGGGGVPSMWLAPEVLGGASKYTENADVYSFGMVCLDILTGKMTQNSREESPVNPIPSPELLTGLVHECRHRDPTQRPRFSAICRILRWIKRCLLLNPEESTAPSVDYLEIDAALSRRFPEWGNSPESDQIPFQMFAYRVMSGKTGNSEGEGTANGDDILPGDDNPIKLPSPAPAYLKLPSLPICSELATKVQRQASLGSAGRKSAPQPKQILKRLTRRKSSDLDIFWKSSG